MLIIRPASPSDVGTLVTLIEDSVRVLQRDTYTPAQIELALANVFGVDSTLIDDGTYFVVQDGGAIVACGGWSKRATLHGGDRYGGRDDRLLDPATAAAKIRAFFVRPECARRGLGTRLLEHCERAARAAGFARVELSSTLAGVPFYLARGYVETGAAEVGLPHGERLAIMRMERTLDGRP